jgi:hypothetical protein
MQEIESGPLEKQPVGEQVNNLRDVGRPGRIAADKRKGVMAAG